MLTGIAALEATDWTKLYHAYGRAEDTPAHLRALISGDEAARKAALEHLDSAVLHQGTPWTVTGAAALVIAGMLADDNLKEQLAPVRRDLVAFLGGVAAACEPAWANSDKLRMMVEFDWESLPGTPADEEFYEDEEAANAFFARSVLGCVEAVPVLMACMLTELKNADYRIRVQAADGAVILSKTEVLRHHATGLQAELLAMARAATDSDERSAHILALGDLGYAPREFLADPSPAVRLCAALAPAFAEEPRAIVILIDALEHHAAEIDGWFACRPPQFHVQPRFHIVTCLIERVHDFEKLANAAVAVAAVTSKHCVDGDWGRLLAAAFPDGDGVIKTAAQRRYLRALVNNAGLWDPVYGNASLWFKKAGLPYNRDDCRRLVE